MKDETLHTTNSKNHFSNLLFYFVKHEKDVCHNFDLNVDVCFVLNMFFNPSLFKRPLTRKREKLELNISIQKKSYIP